MKAMDADRGAEAAGGTNQPAKDTPLKQRRTDRRDEIALFRYEGPERRSGRDRRQSA